MPEDAPGGINPGTPAQKVGFSMSHWRKAVIWRVIVAGGVTPAGGAKALGPARTPAGARAAAPAAAALAAAPPAAVAPNSPPAANGPTTGIPAPAIVSKAARVFRASIWVATIAPRTAANEVVTLTASKVIESLRPRSVIACSRSLTPPSVCFEAA
jgi:hypothetical protein